MVLVASAEHPSKYLMSAVRFWIVERCSPAFCYRAQGDHAGIQSSCNWFHWCDAW
jgi:hypothetical protein